MFKLVDHQNPVPRDYDKIATVDAKVLSEKVFYDEGHRIADKDEVVKMSPADFDVCSELGQVSEAVEEPIVYPDMATMIKAGYHGDALKNASDYDADKVDALIDELTAPSKA